MTESTPSFTVVIPTRERAETLVSTLRTVVDQNYDGLSIVVSDNDSRDATREVVESFKDPRITYINTGRRLSMSRNWEFALAHVKRGFVTYVGDDDGLMPDALTDAASLLTEGRVSALVWKKAQYVWPSSSMPGYPNLLLLPLDNKIFRCDAARVLRDCIRFWTPYFFLPSVYNAFVDFEVFKRIMSRSGAFFHSITPDAYSGFALAGGIDEYLLMTRPLSVNGASGRSNGSSIERYLNTKSGDAEAARYLSEIDQPLHPKLPVAAIGSIVIPVLEALLQANDRCFDGRLDVDIKQGFRRAMREVAKQSRTRYESVAAALRQIGRETGMVDVVEAAIRRYPNVPVQAAPPQLGAIADVLTIDASTLGVADVAAAAKVGGAILGPYVRPSVVRNYHHSAKFASRALRLVQPRMKSWLWD